jgi:hypothetical protein
MPGCTQPAPAAPAALAAPAVIALAVLAVVALAASLTPAPLSAQATTLLVRVTSHDAKIIGSGVGGARVTIRDFRTGAVLAEGIQEGSTGNTSAIMVTPRERGATVYDTDGAAGYLATLQLSQPTMIEITAEGPLGTPHAIQKASKTMLVVPGRDVLGEGIIIELLGFTVELQSPAVDASLVAGTPFTVTASVTMLCGCPTEPGGLWDADRFDVMVRVLDGGKEIDTGLLTYAGTRSTYATELTLSQTGRLELQVLALDDDKGNFGMASQTIEVHPAR